MNEKPLFIPLKREFFEAFKTGEKIEEFRPEGPRWNARTCRVGLAACIRIETEPSEAGSAS